MRTKPDQPTFMFIFRNPADFPKPTPEEMQKNFQKWLTWVQHLKAKGLYIAGDPLEDSPGKVLRGPHGSKVSDGPFVEAKELIGGYFMIHAKNFEEAVEIAKGCPFETRGGQVVEVRQIRPVPM